MKSFMFHLLSLYCLISTLFHEVASAQILQESCRSRVISLPYKNSTKNKKITETQFKSKALWLIPLVGMVLLRHLARYNALTSPYFLLFVL